MLTPLLLTINQVVELLNVSRPTVYELINSGSITTVKIGSRGVRVTLESIIKWIEQYE